MMKRFFSLKRLIELFKEYQWEFVPSDTLKYFGFPMYHRPIFALRLFFVWLVNWKCSGCSGEGVTGYEYRECCDDCSGFGLNFNFNLKQIWVNFWRDKNWEERSYYEFRNYSEQSLKTVVLR